MSRSTFGRATVRLSSILIGISLSVQVGAAQALRAPNRLTVETLIELGIEDLNDFWLQEFSSAGWSYTAPYMLYSYNTSYETRCGPTLPGNAFYCSLDHNVYYDVNLMRQVFATAEFGDFGALTILAHEWSHAVQAQLAADLVPGAVMFQELQADCFAGAYAQFLDAGRSSRLRLDEGDLEEGATFLYALGDTLPWFDAEAHGSPYQRSLNFVIGLAEGIDACFPLFLYRDHENVFSISYPRSWQAYYDDLWSEDGWTYYKWFLMAPQGAEHAELHGYLSEGIRINIQLPRRGNEWLPRYRSEWPSNMIDGLLEAIPSSAWSARRRSRSPRSPAPGT